MSNSQLETKFERLWREMFPDIPLEREYQPGWFNPLSGKRSRFRFDFAHVDSKTLIEINGATWCKGKHSSGVGLIRDYTKINLANINGFMVFSLASQMITDDWLNAIASVVRERVTDSTLSGHPLPTT